MWMTITEMVISCVGDYFRNGDLVSVTITEMVISCVGDNYRNGDLLCG